MKIFLQKVGWLCIASLPLICSLVIQIGVSIISDIIITFISIMELGVEATADIAAFTEYATAQKHHYAGLLIFAYQVLALIIFGIWFYFGCGRPKLTNPVKSFRGRCLPVVIILSFGMCIFATAFVLLGPYFMPKAMETYMELVEASGFGVDSFAIIASILLAPIGEEILCRGLCFHYAKKVTDGINNHTTAFWIANILQALMFGIMHFNFVQGTYAFFLGLGLGWLRERYKSLYPCILSHAIINFSSTYIMGYPLSYLPETLQAYVLLMIFSLVLCALAVCLELSSDNKNTQYS